MIISGTLSTIRNKLNPGNFATLILATLIFYAIDSTSLAQDPPDPGSEAATEIQTARILLLPEPRSMRPPVMEEIQGSERTIRTVAEFDGRDLRMLAGDEVEALDAAQPDWRKHAARAPEGLWESMEVRFLRDTDNVIIAAVIDGNTQQTCSLLFDPSLVERMEDIFGPEFYVAVPTRFRLMIFPKLANRIQEFAPVVLSEFRVSPYPVSPEVFEVSHGGVRVVGLLDDR